MIRRPPRSTLFPTRRSSDLAGLAGVGLRAGVAVVAGRSVGLGGTAADARCRVAGAGGVAVPRSEEDTSELQSPCNIVCRLLLVKKKKTSDASLECLAASCIR